MISPPLSPFLSPFSVFPTHSQLSSCFPHFPLLLPQFSVSRLYPLSLPSSLCPRLSVFDSVILRDYKVNWVSAPSILYGDRHKRDFHRFPNLELKAALLWWKKTSFTSSTATCAHSLSKHDPLSPCCFPSAFVTAARWKTLLSRKDLTKANLFSGWLHWGVWFMQYIFVYFIGP